MQSRQLRLDINWGKILKTACVDAVVWVWFLQAAYQSRFTVYVGEIEYFGQMQLGAPFWLGLAVSLVLVGTQWDQIPKLYRIICSICAPCAVLLVLIVAYFSLYGTVVEVFAAILFVVSYVGCQFLRTETLAKTGSTRSLAMTALCSFVLYYLIAALLLISPDQVYFAFLMLAPLVFIIGANKPLETESTSQPVSWRSFLLLPVLLLAFLGIAGGLLAADGSNDSALSIAYVFEQPSPVMLIMALAFIVLGILASFNYRFRKGMFFAVLNIMWMIGTLIGSLILETFPQVPGSLFVIIASVAGLVIVASFVVFQDAWIKDSLKTDKSKDERIDKIAGAKGLTRRELEILRLLLEGRSIPYIQKLLYIAEGTARTHVRHIYAKLGVHSKQELIDYFGQSTF